MSLLLALTLISAAPKDQWFSVDKSIHATISFTAPFAIRDMLIEVCKVDHTKSTVIALGTMAAAGVGKEWYDSTRPKDYWSWKDLTADAIGLASAGVLMIWKK